MPDTDISPLDLFFASGALLSRLCFALAICGTVSARRYREWTWIGGKIIRRLAHNKRRAASGSIGRRWRVNHGKIKRWRSCAGGHRDNWRYLRCRDGYISIWWQTCSRRAGRKNEGGNVLHALICRLFPDTDPAPDGRNLLLYTAVRLLPPLPNW